MELGFLAKAAQRFWWAIAIWVALGTLAAVAVTEEPTTSFESQALLVITPPSGSAGTTSDRFVASQLVVLRSTAFAADVAQSSPDLELGPADLANAVSFSPITDTDIVRVVATAPTPEAAQTIAESYTDEYLELQRRELAQAEAPRRRALDEVILAAEAELAMVEQQVADAIEPYLPDADDDEATGDIPTIDQIDPRLATERQALVDRYAQLIRDRTEIELGQNASVTARVIQPATLPTVPLPSARSPILYAGPIIGLLAGLATAAVLARISPRVIDDEEAEEILRTPFAGDVPSSRSLSGSLNDVILLSAASAPPAIDDIGVRAEAYAPPGTPFLVLVTGTRRVAGTSAIAAAIAARYAAQGKDVLLMDADIGNPELSRALAHDGAITVQALPDRTFKQASSSDGEPDALDFAPTAIPRLGFVSLDLDGEPAQPSQIVDAAEICRLSARVVVVDGGPLMSSASTLQLSRNADAVVLTVPVRSQKKESLHIVAQQLRTTLNPILPLSMPKTRKRRRAARSAAAKTDTSEQELTAA